MHLTNQRNQTQSDRHPDFLFEEHQGHRNNLEEFITGACLASPERAVPILDREGVEPHHIQADDFRLMVECVRATPDAKDFDLRRKLIRLALIDIGMWSDSDDCWNAPPWNDRALNIFILNAPHGREGIENGMALAACELLRLDAIEREISSLSDRIRALWLNLIPPAPIQQETETISITTADSTDPIVEVWGAL